MDIELNLIEVRVLGCLIEKEIATPDNYPLSLNALVNACNQKSNRDPLMMRDEGAIIDTLDNLRMAHHLAIEVTSTGSRAPKYKHNFAEPLDLFARQNRHPVRTLFARTPSTTRSAGKPFHRIHGKFNA